MLFGLFGEVVGGGCRLRGLGWLGLGLGRHPGVEVSAEYLDAATVAVGCN